MLLELPLSSVNVPFLRSTSVTKPTCEPVAPVGTPLSATATSPTWGVASGVPYPRQFDAMAAPEGGVPPALLIIRCSKFSTPFAGFRIVHVAHKLYEHRLVISVLCSYRQ